jgi:hypothetical protein
LWKSKEPHAPKAANPNQKLGPNKRASIQLL